MLYNINKDEVKCRGSPTFTAKKQKFMQTERYFTFREFLDYMMQFDKKNIDKPSAPEIDLPIVKKLREEKKRRGRTRK